MEDVGKYGLNKIKAKKYFGLKIDVDIPNRKPISCFVDGLQLSSGCTLGKGNIRITPSKKIRVRFHNLKNKKSVSLGMEDTIINNLKKIKTHKESELFARRIYHMKPNRIVKILGGSF